MNDSEFTAPTRQWHAVTRCRHSTSIGIFSDVFEAHVYGEDRDAALINFYRKMHAAGFDPSPNWGVRIVPTDR